MTTALDLITDAMDDAGIIGTGQTPLAEDTTRALKRMNAMIAQWNRRRWLVYHLVDKSWTATGATAYTIGTGGDISATRPDRIETAFFRQNVGVPGNQVDYPLILLQSYEDYSRIALKGMQSFPEYIFYDSGYPLGSIYIWPIPTSQYEIHVLIKDTLQSFANLTDAFELPPEYEEAIRLNLAVRLRVTYQLPADSTLVQLAKVALNTIKNANTQVPSLQMPNDLVRGQIYNIFSDSSY